MAARRAARRHRADAGASRPGGAAAAPASCGRRALVQPLCQQQLEREAHAEAGDFRAHVRQSAAARGRRQIDVHPGILVADEALEKTRREDVIALAVDTALHDVGDRAFQITVEVLIERKIPYAFAAAGAGLYQGTGQPRAVGKYAAG